jgi:5'-3' exonuclease
MKSKEQKRLMVYDANWYIHRAFCTLRTSRPVEQALPYHFLAMVMKDALAVKASHILLAFDGPDVFRYKVYPDYKSGRREKRGAPVDAENAEPGEQKADVYQYLPHIYALLHKLGIVFYQPKTYEADDVLCSVAKAYGEQHKVICATADKDAYQYLTPNVRLYDSSAKGKDGKSKPRYIDVVYAERKKGVRVGQMVDYQTLIGDPGDSVPPIKGIGPAKAKKILEQYGTLKNWHKQCREDREFITAQVDNIRRNRKLVKLVETVLPPNDLEEWKLQKNDKVYQNDKFLSRSFHEFINFLYPKSKGLF